MLRRNREDIRDTIHLKQAITGIKLGNNYAGNNKDTLRI